MNDQDLQHFNQAVALAERGYKPQAHAIFQQLQPRYPRQTTLLLWLAYTTDDLKAARHYIETVNWIDPNHIELVTARAWLGKQEVFAQAEGVFQAASSPIAPIEIPPLFRTLLDRELQPGEQILWAGQPAPFGLLLRPILAGVCILVALWLLQRVGSAHAPLSVFVGLLPLALFGFLVYIIFVSYALYNQARRTLYLITNQRLLLVTTTWLTAPRATEGQKPLLLDQQVWPAYLNYPVSKQPPVLQTRRRGYGYGDLFFDKWRYEGLNGKAFRRVGFLSIRDVAAVRRLVEQVFGGAAVYR